MEEQAATSKIQDKKTLWKWGVSLGLLLVVAAWFSMMRSEYVSFWCAATGFAVSMVSAIKVRHALWRDVAITCSIASGVLLVVYAILYFGIAYVLKSV